MIKKPTGFTVVEMIVVVVIIGVLASITLVSYTSIQQKARDNTRTSDIAAVQKALEKYRADNGVYPRAVVSAGVFGNDNQGYALTTLETVLTPKYILTLPTAPSGTAYSYVRGTGGGAYGIRIDYETRTDCHRGMNNQGLTWWSLQACV